MSSEPANAFNLRHAYMQLDWANDTILIGNTWYGILQSVPNAGLSLESLPNPTVPTRTQQIRWDHRFGKMVRTSFGIENPSEGGWGTGPTAAGTATVLIGRAASILESMAWWSSNQMYAAKSDRTR